MEGFFIDRHPFTDSITSMSRIRSPSSSSSLQRARFLLVCLSPIRPGEWWTHENVYSASNHHRSGRDADEGLPGRSTIPIRREAPKMSSPTRTPEAEAAAEAEPARCGLLDLAPELLEMVAAEIVAGSRSRTTSNLHSAPRARLDDLLALSQTCYRIRQACVPVIFRCIRLLPRYIDGGEIGLAKELARRCRSLAVREDLDWSAWDALSFEPMFQVRELRVAIKPSIGRHDERAMRFQMALARVIVSGLPRLDTVTFSSTQSDSAPDVSLSSCLFGQAYVSVARWQIEGCEVDNRVLLFVCEHTTRLRISRWTVPRRYRVSFNALHQGGFLARSTSMLREVVLEDLRAEMSDLESLLGQLGLCLTTLTFDDVHLVALQPSSVLASRMSALTTLELRHLTRATFDLLIASFSDCTSIDTLVIEGITFCDGSGDLPRSEDVIGFLEGGSFPNLRRLTGQWHIEDGGSVDALAAASLDRIRRACEPRHRLRCELRLIRKGKVEVEVSSAGPLIVDGLQGVEA